MSLIFEVLGSSPYHGNEKVGQILIKALAQLTAPSVEYHNIRNGTGTSSFAPMVIQC